LSVLCLELILFLFYQRKERKNLSFKILSFACLVELKGSYRSKVTLRLSDERIKDDGSFSSFIPVDLDRRKQSACLLVRLHNREDPNLRRVFHNSTDKIGHAHQEISNRHVVTNRPSHFR